MVVCIARFSDLYIEAIMSIPPLLSSSPPPLEENGSVIDHDDDFGEFNDHASVGAVSSSTSITDSSNMFRPIESAELTGGPCLSDENLKPDNLQETDEWSEFGTADAPSSSEPIHTDTVDMSTDQKSVADVADIECVGNPTICISNEGSASELSTASPSASQIIISEAVHLEDVSSDCYNDVDVKCNDENSHYEEQIVGKFDRDLCENMNTACKVANPQCKLEEIEHPVDEDSEVSFSAGDERDLEFDDTVDPVVKENDDCNSFHISYTVAVSDRNECAFATDNQPASDEEGFTDDFQSFSNDIEIRQDIVVDEAKLSVSNNEVSAFISNTEEFSTCIEASAVNVDATDSHSLDTSCKVDFSASASVANEDITSTDQHLTQEQMLASNEEMDDDFDDFEEFVAANEGPTEHQQVVDTSAYQWNAFENIAADGDDWATFQDSDQPVSTNSRSEVSDNNTVFIQQPFAAHSSQLSKVYYFLCASAMLKHVIDIGLTSVRPSITRCWY